MVSHHELAEPGGTIQRVRRVWSRVVMEAEMALTVRQCLSQAICACIAAMIVFVAASSRADAPLTWQSVNAEIQQRYPSVAHITTAELAA